MHIRPLLVMVCVSLLALPSAHASSFTKGREVAPFASALKPGEYFWRPDISPAGPVVIIVSIPDQVLYVYRNGVRIGRSTVSTGAKGHNTPTGVFTVLQKKVKHESSIYKGAQMPHMQRLTWTGIAMHAGNLPGYPASHGCVRLPVDFAEKLYQVTSIGTTVIIEDNSSGAAKTTRPGLIFTKMKGDAATTGNTVWQPDLAPKGPLSILISAADGVMYVYRNGVEIGHSAVSGMGDISGSFAYTALTTVDSSGHRDWMAMDGLGGAPPDLKELRGRVKIDLQFLSDVHPLVVAGTSLIITSEPVNASDKSATGFSVIDTAGK